MPGGGAVHPPRLERDLQIFAARCGLRVDVATAWHPGDVVRLAPEGRPPAGREGVRAGLSLEGEADHGALANERRLVARTWQQLDRADAIDHETALGRHQPG